MVALADGRTAGTLSGGCLEADLVRRAAWIVRSGAAVEHFSTAFDDTSEIPYGLGCGGEVDILAERLGTPEAVALLTALEATLHGEARTALTVLPAGKHSLGSGGFARLILDGNRRTLFASETFPDEMNARRLHASAGEGLVSHLAGTFDTAFGSIFMEHLPPAQRLVIFGAGEDAKPLVRLGAEMGLSVVVVDSRPQHAKPERFPQAQGVLLASLASAVPVHLEDTVVLMTHSYEQDRRLLAELLPVSPRYMGLLGARHRSALLLSEAAALCGITLADAVARTHAPVGLGLGGDGPEAVALAIIAEVQHTLAGTHSRAVTRRLTLSQAEQLLSEGPVIVYAREACALYAEEVAP